MEGTKKTGTGSEIMFLLPSANILLFIVHCAKGLSIELMRNVFH